MTTRDHSHTTRLDPGSAALDPGLVRLAFGSRPPRRSGALATGTPAHLAFLPAEAMEIDLSDPQQRAFGDYELLELLGQGGMGVVYRAWQASLDREVAVKLLSAGPWASREFIERFRREAQSAARMRHPNIVAIHEIGEHEEMNFFSMRLVEGGTLGQLLADRGPLPPREAARMLRTIAEAVDYAHRLDVLHLDLKPGNVLLDGQGEPVVADFGLARRLEGSLATEAAEVSGTPSYMAPEQTLARSALTPATDIYGLGAILYECLCGRPPFGRASAQEVLRSVVDDPPAPLRAQAPAVPADLEAICLRCLEKSQEARYASARALAEDLGRFLEGREVRARPLGLGGRLRLFARRERGLAATAALLVISLVLGMGASALQWRRAERSAHEARALLWESRREEALRLEGEGRGVHAVPRLLANLREQEGAGLGREAALERRRLGLLLGQGATLVDQTIIADASPLAVAMSADGRLLALGLSDQSVRWYRTSDLGEAGRVTLQGQRSALGVPAVPRLLRFVDGHRLRVTMDWVANLTTPFDGDTWLVDLDHAALVPPPAFADFADAVYSADGRHALLRDHARRGQLWQVQPWRALSARGPATGQFSPWLIGPQARFAAFLDTSLENVQLHRLPDLAHPQAVPVPGHAGVSAWAHSGDGRWLALGDFEGRVFLLPLQGATPGALRSLPMPRGREVTWVEFSEDDAWLAIATRDGTAYAFDVASGNPLVAGQMQQDFPLLRVGISHARRLLVAAGAREAALWRLPRQGPRSVAAQRVALGPGAHAQAEEFSTAWSLQTGLFASAGLDGRLRLWRLPEGPTPAALAARQVPERTDFDGHRLVDVEGAQLRLVSPGGRALTPWRALPQAPGFAELLGDGQHLLVSLGPRLQRLDARSLREAGAAIELDASPERLISSPDGLRAVVASSRNGADGHREVLQLVDLQAGRRVPGEATVAGPIRHMAFDRGGARLLVVGPANGATTVFDAGTLHAVGEFPHDEFQPVVWADFDAGGALLLATRAVDARLGSDALLRWDPVSDQVISTRPLGAWRPLGVIATAAGAYVAGDVREGFDPGGARPRGLPRRARSEPTAILATSADGSLLAQAFRREVQVIDVATGAALGPPLQADDDANDTIVQLAFARDGSRLLARTVQGYWHSWPVAPRHEPVDVLSAQAAGWTDGVAGNHVLRLPTAQERAERRRADPGPWPALSPRPAVASVHAGSLHIPVRAPGTSAQLVDLTRYYTFAPDEVRNPFYNVRPQMRPLPIGLQRIDGVDYDLRGMAQFGTYRRLDAATSPTRTGLLCIPVDPSPTLAFRLVLEVSNPVPPPTATVLATLRLHYVDGSEAELPLRTEFELPNFAGRDETVATGLGINSAFPALGFSDPGLSLPRLVNPHPERPVRCVDLRSTQPVNAGVLLAITQEPAVLPARVIASTQIRTPLAAGSETRRNPPAGPAARP